MASTQVVANELASPEEIAYAGESTGYVPPHHRKAHDPAVSFEEYYHYAKLTRADQEERYATNPTVPDSDDAAASASNEKIDEKGGEKKTHLHDTDHTNRMHITPDEWAMASRAVRTATWLSVFYLITTDILGPFGVAFSLATLGWGPGVALYTAFGIMAVFGGWLLYRMFLGLDSYEYPLKTYGDILSVSMAQSCATWSTSSRAFNCFATLVLS